MADRADIARLTVALARAEAENRRLREALEFYADPCDATETKPCAYEGSHSCCQMARAALRETGE